MQLGVRWCMLLGRRWSSPLFIAIGFFMIQPNQAAVLTLFGAYAGTDRTEGLRWVWPWIMRKKISVRAHNVHSDRVKINDLQRQPDRYRLQRGLARRRYRAGDFRRRRLQGSS